MQQGWLRCETCRSVAPHPKARWSGCGRRGTLRSKKPRRWRSTIAISVMSKATSVRSKLPTKFWAERTFNPKQEASMSDRYIPTPHDGQYRPEDRSQEHTSEHHSLMRTWKDVFCLTK